MTQTETQPLITLDMSKLTGKDLRTVLGMFRASVTRGTNGASEQDALLASLDQSEAMLDMLDRTAEGGLAAIPMAHIPRYLEALRTAILEMANPNA